MFQIRNAVALSLLRERAVLSILLKSPEILQAISLSPGILIGSQILFDAIPPKLPPDIGSDVLPPLGGNMFAISYG